MPSPFAPAGQEGAPAVELLVFAAASLTDAFDEIATAFEAAHPEITVLTNYGGSSRLAAQLLEGGVADVFASANEAQMQKVMDAGRIVETPQIFARNRLVVIVPADNPAGIETLADLARPGVKLILANLVSEEENVRQVAAKVALGEADAGVVYASDVTPDIAAAVRQIEVPDAYNVLATYPIARLADAPHSELAQAYIDFVLGEQGQAILQRWGLAPSTQSRG